MHISSDDSKEEYKHQDIQDYDLYYNSNKIKNNKSFDTPNPVRDKSSLCKYKHVSPSLSKFDLNPSGFKGFYPNSKGYFVDSNDYIFFRKL